MSLTSKKYKVSVVTTGPLLGSQPGKDTPASDFLRKKVADEHPELETADEVGTLPEELEKGTTGFYKVDGKPVLYNYQVKGNIKAAAEVLNGLGGHKALKSKVNNTFYVTPRVIPIDGKLSDKPLERPMLGMTMQGPRTSLARSEMLEEGAKFEYFLEVNETPKFKCNEDMLKDILDYACKLGLLQWRNSNFFGTYTYTLTQIR